MFYCFDNQILIFPSYYVEELGHSHVKKRSSYSFFKSLIQDYLCRDLKVQVTRQITRKYANPSPWSNEMRQACLNVPLKPSVFLICP